MVFLIEMVVNQMVFTKVLNCGPGSKDKKNNSKENLKIVKKRLVKNQKIFFYYIKFIVITLFLLIKILRFKQKKIKADAIITDQRKFL